MNRISDPAVAPWYRHRWPWILMAGPLVVVVAGLFTAYLAISSNDGLVDDDYYKQGLAVNQLTDRDQRAQALRLQADLLLGGDGRQLRLLLRGDPGFVAPESLILRITHPTRGGMDQTLKLRADGTGSYGAVLAAPLSGRWHLALEDAAGAWRLTGNWNAGEEASVRLPGGAAPAR